MILKIHHRFNYTYSGPVSFGDQFLRLCPRSDHSLKLLSIAVQTSPASTERWIRDVFNNPILVKNLGLTESTELHFEARIEVEVKEENPFNFILDPHATAYPLNYTQAEKAALRPQIESRIANADSVIDWFYQAVPSPVTHPDTVQFLSDLNTAVRRDIGYVRRDEPGVQSPDETLQLRCGSCRDMAWLFIALCRQLGLAARFVSGYLYDPPIESGNAGDHLFNRAVGSMHAWAEVYLPGAGWKGFDPTNGILANSFFIPCAVSIDHEGAAPTSGKYFTKEAIQSTLDVTLDIAQA